MWVLVLLILIYDTRAECLYRSVLPKSMRMSDPPENVDSIQFLLGLAPFNFNGRLDTDQRCIDYCTSQPWCYAVSRHPVPTEHFCMFHTDLSSLGFFTTTPEHYTCTTVANFGCVMDPDVLLNIGDEVFELVGLDETFGGKIGQGIMPSEIVTSPTCHVVKNDTEAIHVSNSTTLFSEYYGQKPVAPGAWYVETKDKLGAGVDGPPTDFS